MYWLHTDETNVGRNSGKFFIYGGLVSTVTQMVGAHHKVEAIRKKYGYRSGDSFKFDTNKRPTSVSVTDCTAAKQEAMRAVADLGIQMIVTAVHHDVAKNKTDDERGIWALQNLSLHFNSRYLRPIREFGALCVDRLPDHYAYSQFDAMFRSQIDFGSSKLELPNIIHYSATSHGASHINSLVDITLGGFRYCANAAFSEDARQKSAAQKIGPQLSKILWTGHQQTQYTTNGIKIYPKKWNELHSTAILSDYKTLLREMERMILPGSSP